MKALSSEERKQFLAKIEAPDASNKITFDLERATHEPGMLFSEAAMGQLMELIQLFVGGRVIGFYNATQREPDKVKVTVIVENIEKHATPGHHRMGSS